MHDTDQYIYTNSEYYIRYLHNDFSNNRKQIIISLNNKIQRFNKLLASNKKIIFIRIQENLLNITNRILTEIQIENYKIPEIDNLIEISKWLNANTKLTFNIIYLNTLQDDYYDEAHNILCIMDTINEYTWENVATRIYDKLNSKESLLKKYLLFYLF
jgi:hypothetical protein